jgi:hypothetical protein
VQDDAKELITAFFQQRCNLVGRKDSRAILTQRPGSVRLQGLYHAKSTGLLLTQLALGNGIATQQLLMFPLDQQINSVCSGIDSGDG